MNGPSTSALAALKAFARAPSPLTRCERCETPLAARHEHLVDRQIHNLACVCLPCAHGVADDGDWTWKRVQPFVRSLHDATLGERVLSSFHIPVGLAFVFHRSVDSLCIARFPGPSGIAEAAMPFDTWHAMETGDPATHGMSPDVHALLVNRIDGAREQYRVSIDHCFKLAGILRLRGRSPSGHGELPQGMREFFDDLAFAAKVPDA